MLITEKERSIPLKRANINFIKETNLQKLKQLKESYSTYFPFHIISLNYKMFSSFLTVCLLRFVYVEKNY